MPNQGVDSQNSGVDGSREPDLYLCVSVQVPKEVAQVVPLFSVNGVHHSYLFDPFIQILPALKKQAGPYFGQFRVDLDPFIFALGRGLPAVVFILTGVKMVVRMDVIQIAGILDFGAGGHCRNFHDFQFFGGEVFDVVNELRTRPLLFGCSKGAEEEDEDNRGCVLEEGDVIVG